MEPSVDVFRKHQRTGSHHGMILGERVSSRLTSLVGAIAITSNVCMLQTRSASIELISQLGTVKVDKPEITDLEFR
jgi:hypothetical protein